MINGQVSASSASGISSRDGTVGHAESAMVNESASVPSAPRMPEEVKGATGAKASAAPKIIWWVVTEEEATECLQLKFWDGALNARTAPYIRPAVRADSSKMQADGEVCD